MITSILKKIIISNDLVSAFLIVGLLSLLSNYISKLTKGRVHSSAIAILLGLILAFFGGVIAKGSKGISDLELFLEHNKKKNRRHV